MRSLYHKTLFACFFLHGCTLRAFEQLRCPSFHQWCHSASTEHQQCADCGWRYVGETGRCFAIRRKEHIRNVKTCANGSKIQTLQNMRGHSTIAYTFTILASTTKALSALEKRWMIGTPLLLSMLTIILAKRVWISCSKPIPNQYCILFKKKSPN